MATKTEIYELRKKEENDFYNIEDFNNNMDTLEKALTEFDDSGTAEGVTSFPEMLTKLVTGNKLAITLKNLKAGLQFVLHAGSIVNNCVTDNANLPVSAAMAKSLQDQINQANSNLKTPVIGNPTFDSSYFTNKGTQIKKIGTTVTVKIVGTIKFDAMTSFATNKIMDIPEGFRPIWSIGEYHILGKNVTDLIMIESTSIGINKQFSSGNQNVEFSIIYLTSE